MPYQVLHWVCNIDCLCHILVVIPTYELLLLLSPICPPLSLAGPHALLVQYISYAIPSCANTFPELVIVDPHGHKGEHASKTTHGVRLLRRHSIDDFNALAAAMKYVLHGLPPFVPPQASPNSFARTLFEPCRRLRLLARLTARIKDQRC